jgi:hypothetical protein
LQRPERTRPSTGEQIAGACGVLLLISLALPWYGRDTNVAGAVISESWTAWQAMSTLAIVLFAIAVLAVAVPLARFLWATALRADRVLVPLGLLGLAIVLFRMVDVPIPDVTLQGDDSVDSDRGAGLFLALVSTAGIAYGGRRAGRA